MKKLFIAAALAAVCTLSGAEKKDYSDYLKVATDQGGGSKLWTMVSSHANPVTKKLNLEVSQNLSILLSTCKLSKEWLMASILLTFTKRANIRNRDINIIVLDEMNIARVEYYFAEMLSILEMPDPNEWKIELVPSMWQTDPKHLIDGKLHIPQNVWYIGTANNDDSTFAVSDKVYDRALVINLDSKGIPFDAPVTEAKRINYSYVESLYRKAIQDHPVSEEHLEKIAKLDMYVIERFRVAFGNRIMKQLKVFVPVYVACGGEAVEAIDYLLATKVFRKFEGLNLSLIRDEIKGLIRYMEMLFGKGSMPECTAYLQRLQKMY